MESNTAMIKKNTRIMPEQRAVVCCISCRYFSLVCGFLKLYAIKKILKSKSPKKQKSVHNNSSIVILFDVDSLVAPPSLALSPRGEGIRFG
jgi:hypothetical protein